MKLKDWVNALLRHVSCLVSRTFEAQLFLAADKLRKNLEPSDYSNPPTQLNLIPPRGAHNLTMADSKPKMAFETVRLRTGGAASCSRTEGSLKSMGSTERRRHSLDRTRIRRVAKAI
jgi:hypothetical protein